jgi:hypothetical protein
MVGDKVQKPLDTTRLSEPRAVDLDLHVEETIDERIAVAGAIDGDTTA